MDAAFEKRQATTAQMKGELGTARDEVFMVCFATEDRKLPKPPKAAPVDESPKQAEGGAPAADVPAEEASKDEKAPASPPKEEAPPVSLLPNASMEIYPVLGVVNESEPKLLVRWAPKDAPPDPMADDGMSFKFLSIADLKKAGGTVVQMYTLASSNEVQRNDWQIVREMAGYASSVTRA